MTQIGHEGLQNADGVQSVNATLNRSRQTARRATMSGQSDATADTTKDATKRAYKPRARACKQCGKSFTPKRSAARFCSDNCRKNAYRRRVAHGRPVAKKDPALVMITCLHCGLTNLVPAGKGAKFCTPKCRKRSFKLRREATISKLGALFTALTFEQIEDRIDQHGLATAMKTLTDRGYVYNYQAFAWEMVQQT